jgi:hypothetical protein
MKFLFIMVLACRHFEAIAVVVNLISPVLYALLDRLVNPRYTKAGYRD